MNLLFILLLFFQSPDKSNTLYEVGRPQSLEYNNAKRIVGKQWNIEWVYADNSLVEKMGHEKIAQHNDSVMNLIAQKRGKNWQERFYPAVHEELDKQNKMRALLKSSKDYERVREKLVEPHILFERKRKKKRSAYIVHISGQKKEDPGAGFITLCKFDYKPQKDQPVFDCKEQALTISFPANGVK
jgi:hypothetical protein